MQGSQHPVTSQPGKEVTKWELKCFLGAQMDPRTSRRMLGAEMEAWGLTNTQGTPGDPREFQGSGRARTAPCVQRTSNARATYVQRTCNVDKMHTLNVQR